MTGEIGRKHFVIILENSLQEFSCITCCILPSDLTNRFSDKKKKPLTRYKQYNSHTINHNYRNYSCQYFCFNSFCTSILCREKYCILCLIEIIDMQQTILIYTRVIFLTSFSHASSSPALARCTNQESILYFIHVFSPPFSIYSRMPRHSCCEMRVMQCMTYFFCASLQSCRRLYQMGGLTPPLILICCSPPTEVGVISHLI